MTGTSPPCARPCSLCAIGEIRHLEIGRDELHDARSWSLVLIMEFASVDALRAYQRHPQHLALMAFNDPFVLNVASVDFTVGRSLSLAPVEVDRVDSCSDALC